MCVTAIAGGAVLGMSAQITNDLPVVWGDLVFIAGVVGALVGLPTLPVVLVSLRRKPLRIAIPVVYGPSFVVVIAYVLFAPLSDNDPLDAAIPAFISVCVLCGLAWVALPNTFCFAPTRRCPDCNYDLRGSSEDRCPECGWSRDPPLAGSSTPST